MTERWYAWEEARKIARDDPTVDLNADETQIAYDPSRKPYTQTLEDPVPEDEFRHPEDKRVRV